MKETFPILGNFSNKHFRKKAKFTKNITLLSMAPIYDSVQLVNPRRSWYKYGINTENGNFTPDKSRGPQAPRYLSGVKPTFEVLIIITYLLRPRETVCLWTRDRRCCPRLRLRQQRRSRGHKTHCFPEVSVNKCFVI